MLRETHWLGHGRNVEWPAAAQTQFRDLIRQFQVLLPDLQWNDKSIHSKTVTRRTGSIKKQAPPASLFSVPDSQSSWPVKNNISAVLFLFLFHSFLLPSSPCFIYLLMTPHLVKLRCIEMWCDLMSHLCKLQHQNLKLENEICGSMLEKNGPGLSQIDICMITT